MNEPQATGHEEESKSGDGKPNEDKFVQQADRAPTNNAAPAAQHPSPNDQHKHLPSDLLRAFGYFLRHYWNAPRTKSKWTDIAGIGVNLLIAGAAFYSAWVFQGQLNVARDTLYAQTRPWVGTGKIEIKNTAFLIYPGNPPQARSQFNFEITVPLKDTGNSPALNVEMGVGGALTKEIGAFQSVQPMMDFECGGANNNATRAGTALFPSSPETPLGWETDLGTPFARPDDVRRIWIPICVVYSDTTTEKRLHHTKVWMVSWPINGKPKETRRTTTEPIIIYYSLPIGGWSVARIEAD